MSKARETKQKRRPVTKLFFSFCSVFRKLHILMQQHKEENFPRIKKSGVERIANSRTLPRVCRLPTHPAIAIIVLFWPHFFLRDDVEKICSLCDRVGKNIKWTNSGFGRDEHQGSPPVSNNFLLAVRWKITKEENGTKTRFNVPIFEKGTFYIFLTIFRPGGRGGGIIQTGLSWEDRRLFQNQMPITCMFLYVPRILNSSSSSPVKTKSGECVFWQFPCKLLIIYDKPNEMSLCQQ